MIWGIIYLDLDILYNNRSFIILIYKNLNKYNNLFIYIDVVNIGQFSLSTHSFNDSTIYQGQNSSLTQPTQYSNMNQSPISLSTQPLQESTINQGQNSKQNKTKNKNRKTKK